MVTKQQAYASQGPPFPFLSIERVQFTAGLDLNETGDLIRTGDVKEALQFVGEPSDEIDANWMSLIRTSRKSRGKTHAMQY